MVPVRTCDGRGAASAPAWFGLVGALIGAVAAVVHAVAHFALGDAVAAVLSIGAMVLLTGGLHQDGLADCVDAIGVRGHRERRLQVMREPTIGSYGALALVFWALLSTTSLAALSAREAAWALVCAASAGRLAALLHASWTPPARRDGLGAAFTPSPPAVVLTALTATGLAVLGFGVRAAAALLAAGVAAALVAGWARRRLGGRTGDTIGASVVLAELGVVLVLLATAQEA